MKQIVQHQKSGKLSLNDLPVPSIRPGFALVRTGFSVISAGTERSSVAVAQASMLGKARTRPDLAKQVLDNVKKEGLFATYRKVQNRLDNYKELGYSSAGIVVESSSERFRPGDRVASAGAGYASHAEYVLVPQNLLALVPQDVSLEEAAFTTIAAIAMQGIRQAEVRIGESVAVIGLGLIGLITVQMLKANGCRVMGVDIGPTNFELARTFGCEECVLSDAAAVRKAESFTRGIGTDAVIITAATRSSKPLELSMEMARKKSRVVVVGAVGMHVPRSPFYEKEVDLRISCSYGPGRYDRHYEEEGQDYPVGHVRWTEQRNMVAVLDLMAEKRLNVRSMVTHRFPIAQALDAYALLTGRTRERYLGIILEYGIGGEREIVRRVAVPGGVSPDAGRSLGVGFVGAGNFAQSNLLPFLRGRDLQLLGVATAHPVSARSVASKFGFAYCATEAAEVLQDSSIGVVFIASRHDSHAPYVIEAVRHGKHVFVEKPLATNEKDLQAIRRIIEGQKEGSRRHITVGFNRRFSRPFRDIADFFRGRRDPMTLLYRVNAGTLASGHWLHDRRQGGRIIGEACHFIDCMAYLTNARPVEVHAVSGDVRGEHAGPETVNVVLTFADGSVGSLAYLANGAPSLEKEYCEVFCEQKTAILRDFTEVTFHGNGRRHRKRYDGTKGHREEVEHFLRVSEGKENPVLPFDVLYDVTLATFRIEESLQKGKPVRV